MAEATAFPIHPSRGAKTLHALVGEVPTPVIVNARFSTYRGFDRDQDAGLVEILLNGLLEVEHRKIKRDLDLDGEAGLGSNDDGGGYGDFELKGLKITSTRGSYRIDSRSYSSKI